MYIIEPKHNKITRHIIPLNTEMGFYKQPVWIHRSTLPKNTDAAVL